MKKVITGLATFILLLFVMDATAQNYSIKERWNIRLGYAQYPRVLPGIYHNFRTEVNYGILNFAEIGGYIGYHVHDTFHQPIITDEDTVLYFDGSKDAIALSYGASISIHLLPLLLRTKDFWMDVYLTGKYGGYCVLSDKDYYPERINVPDYGIYGGLALYPFKHVGFFGEYGYGNKTDLRFGLCVKF